MLITVTYSHRRNSSNFYSSFFFEDVAGYCANEVETEQIVDTSTYGLFLLSLSSSLIYSRVGG